MALIQGTVDDAMAPARRWPGERVERVERAERAGADADPPVAWFELWAPDLEATLARVTELGAVIELRRTDLPSGNALVIIRDPCGNRLGLWAS